MKQISLIIYFLISCTLIQAQDLKFNDATDYEKWIMNYYKDPQPDNLFEAFKYGVTDKEIANTGNRDIILSFFAAIFKQDTLIQNDFYNRLKTEKNQNLRYGYIFTLWCTNDDYSMIRLREFQQLKINKKDIANIDSLIKTKPIDIFNDSISYPAHLDMCWAEFFATGKKKGVLKIITALENTNSTDYYKKVVASSARWSLRNNAYRHEKVYEIISEQIENVKSDIAGELRSILKEVDEKRKG